MSAELECAASVCESIEECYMQFYKDVLNTLYDLKNEEIRLDVKRSVQKVLKIKHSERESDITPEVYMDYSLEADRCAYIYHCCVLHTKMVNFHFKEFLLENSIIRKKLAKVEKLRICCLSGGSCFDVVAIVKVINDLEVRKTSKEKEPLNLEITIVEECSGWKRDSLKIMDILKELPNLNITIDVNFLEEGIFKSFDDTLKNIINKAHFVTMVKKSKDIQRKFPGRQSSKTRKIIFNIMDCMRVRGCFFVIDNGGGGIPVDFRSAFTDNHSWTSIYSRSHETHTLDGDTRRKLAKDLLLQSNCARETRVFSHVWIKKKPETSEIKPKGKYSAENFKTKKSRGKK